MFKHVSNIISNEVPVSGKMDEFSPIDGFAEIIECLAEMTQYIANEPSVGLFYIQQHTQTTVPNLVKLKNNASGKSHEMSLETEDSEDSVMMVRSIKECGFPIVDEMVKDITKSLAIMSTKEPRKGLINNSSPRFHLGRTSSWASGRWNRKEDMSPQYSRSNSSYFTKVFKSAQERAGNMNYVQSNTSELSQTKNQKLLIPALPYAAASTSSTDIEVEELPLSCQIVEERQDESETDANLTKGQLPFTSGNFDAFKADKESKLEEWLRYTDNHHSHTGETTARNMLTHSDADEALT